MKRWAVSAVNLSGTEWGTTQIVYADDWQHAIMLHPLLAEFDIDTSGTIENAKRELSDEDILMECVEIVI